MTLGTRIVVLKDGVIQQVDTPQNLYDKPANKFVAGFIGSPQMNLIDAKVVQVGNQVNVQFGNADITLPDEKGKVDASNSWSAMKIAISEANAQFIALCHIE